MSTDTKIAEGARKAPSAALWLALFALVAAAGGIALLLPQFGQPIDPITPAIERGYARCHASTCRTGSLIPELFAHGEAKTSVEVKLRRAGYMDRNGFYGKAAHSDVPGCDLSYYVVPRYDPSGGLTLAFGEVAESCN